MFIKREQQVGWLRKEASLGIFEKKNPALALFLKSPVQWSKNLQMNFPSNEEHITEGTSLEEGPQNPPPDMSLSVLVTAHLKLHHATTLIHPQCPALLQSPQGGHRTVAPFRVQLKGGGPHLLAPLCWSPPGSPCIHYVLGTTLATIRNTFQVLEDRPICWLARCLRWKEKPTAHI